MTEKRFNVFDVDGTIFLEDHNEGSYHIGQLGNVDINCLNDIASKLNELYDENEQLKNLINKHMDTDLENPIDIVFKLAEKNQELKEEKFELKCENKRLKRIINNKETEWLRNNTVWEQMPSTKRTVTKTLK